MGYSHYWHQTRGPIAQEAWEDLCRDARALIAACPVRLARWENSDEAPEVSPDRIVFNGTPDPDGHEAFILRRVPDKEFCFCKTFGKPYDAVVCAVLALAAEHAGDCIRIESDGFAQDWEPSVQWASEVLRRFVGNPI